MSTSTPWLSGFCNQSNPADSHARCHGSTSNQGETLACCCPCHTDPSPAPAVAAAVEPHDTDTSVVDEASAGEAPPRLGVYDDLDEVVYHADPTSISASGMKTLLKQSPAHFLYERTHPKTSKAMDLGTVAHAMVLGVGAGFVAIEGNRNRNDVKDAIAEAEAQGLVVLKPDELAAAERMADAVLRHPTASALLTAPGRSEVSMFWRDPAFDLIRRCRWDRLTDDGIGIDLKTTKDAEPEALRKTITLEAGYGYDLSAAWYLAVAAGLGVDITAYALVFVESTQPHPVVVVEPTQFLDRGTALATKALRIYRDCLDTGQWPGYADTGFLQLSPPHWADTPEQITLTIPEGTAA